jgi:hypothetical protein
MKEIKMKFESNEDYNEFIEICKDSKNVELSENEILIKKQEE